MDPPGAGRLWERFSTEQLNVVLDQIAAGMPGGVRYAANKNAGDRWAGLLLVAELDVTEPQASEMLRQWITNGVLEKVAYRDPVQRKDRVGLRVNHTKRPGTEYR